MSNDNKGSRAKIIDNLSAKETLEQIQGFEKLINIYDAIPFAGAFFPGLEKFANDFQEVKKKSEIFFVPDKFNEKFSDVGWIAYESMHLDTMVKAVELADIEGMEVAENFLAEHYDEKIIEFGIYRFNGHPEFRRRIRLIELAKLDYLAGRFHACVPLLLALIDGIVNDVSKRIGFFAEGSDLNAWDSIAAHETGLATLSKVMGVGRNKTNDDPIKIPYRNGILHGRELAFDNKIVAAKCWAALFSIRDWARALENEKKPSKTEKKDDIWSALQQLAKNQEVSKAIDNWSPRNASEFGYLPHDGNSALLPDGTPEKVVAEFLENWIKKRFGPMVDSLLYYGQATKGKRAGQIKEDFGRRTLKSYRIIGVRDEAPAISQVQAELIFEKEGGSSEVQADVRVVFNDAEGNSALRGYEEGAWYIVQNSFSHIIYAIF